MKTIRFSNITCKCVVKPLVLATLETSPYTSIKSIDISLVLTAKFDDASVMMQNDDLSLVLTVKFDDAILMMQI